MVKDIHTADLSSELATRQGVTSYSVKPHEPYTIKIGDREITATGPAILIINED